jgi:uncharacterized protein YjbI with pentapeptide repeats
MAIESKTAQSIVETWWEAWREEDYSWNGLSLKPWVGWSIEDALPIRNDKASAEARPATLQDFWRAEQEHLVRNSATGEIYTVVHAPYRWRDRAACKSSWSASQFAQVDEALGRALARLPPGAFDDPEPREAPKSPPSPDARLIDLGRVWPAPLHGAVVATLPARVLALPIILARQIAHIERLDIEADAGIIELNTSLFMGRAAFETPNADLRLHGAVVCGDLEVRPKGLRKLYAPLAHIFGDCMLSGIEVAEAINLTRTTFHSVLLAPEMAAPLLRLSHVNFAHRVDLAGARIDDLRCDHAIFDKDFILVTAAIGKAFFDGAQFCGRAIFKECKVADIAIFDGAEWKGSAEFHGASLNEGSFTGGRFGGEANFERVVFSNRLSFQSAQFEQVAVFDEVDWPGSPYSVGQMFREARFRGYASFLGDDFWAYAAFDGAKIDIEARFSRASFKRDKGLAAALDMVFQPEHLEELEHGLRVLKGAAEAVRDRELEHRFYAYQLKVRQRGPLDYVQKSALSIYALVSNFGLSLGRPLLCVVGLWAVCGALFLAIGVVSGDGTTAGITLVPGPVHPAVWEALEMSARGVFSLLGTWALRPPANLQDFADLESALLWRRADIGFLVRFIWSVEAICAGVLVFLSALAVRRWFQIN